ncbi:MAG TPA: polysaccharide biosynthesis/export family protein, partial [Fimbriimonadaceae bacterium]|nr:polysaccharide biosynthesis/export family protein [Fimbriimonadaceae bacterium]
MKGALATVVFLLLSMAAFGQSSNSKVYRIRPDDILRIQVYGEAQVNVEIPVGEDGSISAPFVGSFMVEGKTTGEVEAELTKAYQDRLRLR